MHGMEVSPPTFSSEKYYGLQIVVLTTSSLRLQGVPQNKSPHLRSHHSCGSPCPGTDIRSYPNPVIEDSLRDKSARPHGLQGSPCAWPKLCWGSPKVWILSLPSCSARAFLPLGWYLINILHTKGYWCTIALFLLLKTIICNNIKSEVENGYRIGKEVISLWHLIFFGV